MTQKRLSPFLKLECVVVSLVVSSVNQNPTCLSVNLDMVKFYLVKNNN